MSCFGFGFLVDRHTSTVSNVAIRWWFPILSCFNLIRKNRLRPSCLYYNHAHIVVPLSTSQPIDMFMKLGMIILPLDAAALLNFFIS